MRKTVVLLSGGMDSAVLLHHLRGCGDDVLALGVNYGQRHMKELNAAHNIAFEAGVPFEVAHFAQLCYLLPGNSQTDLNVPVPEGHYEDPKMKATVVPNRNMILLAAAAGYAIAHDASAVAFGAHAGDRAIYPDCRPEYVSALRETLKLCHFRPVDLLVPFLFMDKQGIVSTGHALGVPFELTRSCYATWDGHCGRCGACVERREAFVLAGVPDPTPYRS